MLGVTLNTIPLVLGQGAERHVFRVKLFVVDGLILDMNISINFLAHQGIDQLHS